MVNRPNWGWIAKAKFAIGYASAKAVLPFEVRSPRAPFAIYEWRYSLTNLVNSVRPGLLPKAYYDGPTEIATSTGKFQVRAKTQDAALISPAFEKVDIRKLLEVLDEELRAKSRVVFCDVGANIGHFAVRVGLRFGKTSLQSFLFEPIPENCKLLESNLRLNDLLSQKLQILPYALSDSSGPAHISFNREDAGDSHLIEVGGLEIQKRRGDECLASVEKLDCLVLKIDVEGHEREVLRGFTDTIARSARVWLCLEDIFHREELYALLDELGFEFVQKQSPYNSWWRKN